ncbi:MAG TPA: discoidin domain-containing protein, partial [Polyangia bacterium]
DNPLAGNTNANAKRIIASGLRNPYRFTIHPTSGELWIGDVGWGGYEEINRMGRAAPAENFGWPCWEGAPRQGGYDSANLTICEDLYATTQHVAPHYAYHHNNKIVTGETCTTGSSSISGLAVYNTGNYPTDYNGALFFADYTRKCIWVMRATNGVPDATRIGNFITAAANPVDLQIGPGGDLFYVDLDGGAIRRVRYRVPNAVATANPTSGGVPLTVSFDGRASTPYTAGATLAYAWDLDNDGAFDDGTASTASFTYNTQGSFTARLRVTETGGGSDISNPITITTGPPNNAPVPTIATPAAGSTWIVGSNIAFSGSATDTEDGTIPASRLSWDVVMQHCPSDCHPHLIQTFTGVASGSFNAPDHEYPSYIELKLTATDNGGSSTTVTRRLDPQTVNLTFNASPATTPGLQLGFGGAQIATPFTRPVIIGSSHSVSAPNQSVGGTSYAFSSWSDGGAASHTIVAPATAATYTATFVASPWSSQDVGAVAAAGSWSLAGETFTVAGSGEDIWNANDEFRFVYRNITGDVTVTARVASITNTNTWAKAGVMIRDGMANNARHFAAVATPVAANTYLFQHRLTAGAAATATAGGSGAVPGWLRLVRAGNTFTAFTSTNGTTWTQYGTAVTSTFPATLAVGLAVTSHADGVLNTATFDNVSITQPVTGPPGAPAGLTATAGNTQVSLAWNSSSGATSYTVKRSTTSGGPYSTVVGGLAGTSYTNTGLTNGTTYHYVVTASNSSGESGNSNQASATPNLSVPSAPTGVVASPGNNQVGLTWNAVSGATSYTVKRATTSGGPYTNVGTGLTATSYTNTGLTNGTTYYFVVSASNSAGESGNSGQVSATPSGAATCQAVALTATGATASSQESATYTPAMAIDGNVGTRWSSVFSDPQWIQVDLGALRKVSRVRLTWEAAASANYNIQVATAAAGPYTTVHTNTAGNGGIDDISLVPVDARYVRMLSNARTGVYGNSLFEFQVYGDTNASCAVASTTCFDGVQNQGETGVDCGGPCAVCASVCTSVALTRSSATASSTESASYPASNAIDASATTRWSSAFADPQWIRIDLGADRRVNRAVLNWEGAASANYNIELSSSTAGPWQTLIAVPTANGGIDDMTFIGGVGRYIRMYSTARTTVYGNSLWDFAVYGDNNVACK